MADELFDISEGEAALLDTYERLHAILEQHGDDLPPFARRNAVKALAALWQVANGLGRQPGQVYDVGA
jgi:predicted component of type VI protein secretion system